MHTCLLAEKRKGCYFYETLCNNYRVLQALGLETGTLYTCRDGYYDLPLSHNTSATDDDR